MDWITIALVTHISSGYLGLFSGFVAVYAKKKKGLHSKAGTVFFYSLIIANITALILSTVRFSPFLFVIALFTLYLICGGKIVVAVKRRELLARYWKLLMYSGILIIVLLLSVASLMLQNNPGPAIVLYVFSLVMILLVTDDFRRNPAENPQNKIYQHINKMGGGFIAATTAFLVVNISFLPPLLVWIAPTVIGSVLIAKGTRQYKRRTAKA